VPAPQVALAAAAAEVATRAPPAAVRAALERGVEASPRCPLLWRLLVRAEAAAGRPVGARRALLRGVAACPGAKALWLDGLAALNGAAGVAQREVAELAVAMRAHVHVRVDALEAALAVS
jgi:hypothetical protein